MNAKERRQKIAHLLENSSQPLTGGELAAKLGVSRQLIVQDIALLRAGGTEILATPQGYLLIKMISTPLCRRTYAVTHSAAQLPQELNEIVDCGGRVVDVRVEHPVYGEITGLLMLTSRKEVADFVARLDASQAQPLSALTSGVHLHTVEALIEDVLDRVQERLQKLRFLIEE